MGLGIEISVNNVPDSGLANSVAMVEVEERMGQAASYRIQFAADISEGDLPLLTESKLDAGSELAVNVPIDSGKACLVKGPVTGQYIQLKHGGAGSVLEVRGSDKSVVMDREAKSSIWSGTDSDAVSAITATYSLVPDITTTSATHFEDKHTLIQRCTDLEFVKQLARRNGFLFWISCDEFGVETAHFKRPPVEEVTDTELVINFDSPNIEQLDIEWHIERPSSVSALQLDLNALSDIDGNVAATPLPLLASQGVNTISSETRSQYLTAPSDDSGDLMARGEGALIDSGWFIRASCQTNYAVLGQLVRANTVINLRGAGSRHSGRYYVAAVRHVIDAVAHKMEIELLRNAWE